MANTTNFNWETPDDTDLVKDGAAAIRTLGSAIDTSLVDLKGGTTGQVLSKATNTDMDFTWVAQDDSNAIQNAIVDAKGDIIAASANDTPARLAVGTNDYRLVAASGETTGLKYVADTQNTVIDAEGDLLVGDAADVVQRLAIGSNAQVLTVDTTVDGKIKWATPASASATFVGCQLEKITTAQSLTNNTDTAVTFNSEVFDTDGFHDNSTNNSRITIPSGKAGKYLLTAQISFAANATGVRVVKIFKNGSILMLPSVIAPAPATDFTVINNTTLVNASVGDYFEVFALQSSGGALNLNISQSNGVGCFFGATFVGA
jgi:hypothetical protein